MLRRAFIVALVGASLSCAKLAGLSGHVAGSDDGGTSNSAGRDGGASAPDMGGATAGEGGASGSADAAGASGGDALASRDVPYNQLAPAPMCSGPDAAVCPTGHGNCHGSGCDVLLTSDRNNCGACGRSCGDGECQDGECQPITIASGQAFESHRQVAASAAGVIWGTSDGFVKLLPFGAGAGATPRVLAQNEGHVLDVVVDDRYAYAMSDGQGCDGQGDWCIRRFALAPGAEPPLTLAGVTAYSGGMAIDADAIYWYDSHGLIMRYPTHTPGAMAQQLAANQSNGTNFGIAIDRDYVYWGTNGDTEALIKRIHLDGRDVAPEHVAAGLVSVQAVAVDELNAYWTTADARLIQMAPKDGSGAPVTLATDDRPTSGIAVDEVNVYWGSGGGTSGLRKVAKCGGPIHIVSGGKAVFGLFAWMGNIYWNDDESGLFREAQ